MATRRTFLKNTSLLGAGALASGTVLRDASGQNAPRVQNAIAGAAPAIPVSTRRGDMWFRTLGRTGEQVSLIGLGGFHIGTQKDVEESYRLIRSAIDRGITFMDNCWDYNNGESEIRMGVALRNGYRDKVYLMSKIDGRTKASAARQIDESLKRLQTDRIDMMQVHEIIRLEDPDRIFAANGTMDALLEAQKAGKVRHIGFTGHKDPFVHLRTLDMAAQNGIRFDAVQMPINVMDVHFRSFGREVLPRLVRENIGVLAMKTFGGRNIVTHVLKSGTAKPIELLHYSMTQPVSTVITGCERMEILDQAVEAARTFVPMTVAQTQALLEKMRAPALTGQHELFKTSDRFDGTAKNPQWLG